MFLPVLGLLAASIGPGIQPQLATAGNRVVIAYGSTGSVFVTQSVDGGKTFGAPVRVASGEKLALGRHRGPRIAIAGQAIVVSAIYGGELKSWRSADGGKTFAAPVAINDVPNAAREGLHAMAAGPDGTVFAAWLDLREPGTTLAGSFSGDGGATWSKNTVVYQSPEKSICECCHPTVTVGPDGTIYAMWRNALGGNRDMYLARSTDGGKTFAAAEKLGVDSWKLEACPMDGGGVAAAKGSVATAWRRGSEVYFAKPGTPEQKLGAGKDPAIAIGPKGPQVLWNEAGTVRGWPAKVDTAGTHPQIIATEAGLVGAWESGGGIEVRRIE